MVPADAAKTWVMPVTTIGWFAAISNVITAELLFGVVEGMVLMVVWAKTQLPSNEAAAVKTKFLTDMILIDYCGEIMNKDSNEL